MRRGPPSDPLAYPTFPYTAPFPSLVSAAVAARVGSPVWRAIGEAKLWMRPLSDTFIADYVAQNWDSIRWTVGCYEIEGAGVQLFEKVEGDPWTIIGMQLLPLLAWLSPTGLAAPCARPQRKSPAIRLPPRHRRCTNAAC